MSEELSETMAVFFVFFVWCFSKGRLPLLVVRAIILGSQPYSL